VGDTEDHPMSSFADRARSALSRIEQDDRVRQTTAAAKSVAAQAEGELADLPTGRSSR
jgi:hypothetical protein